MSDPRDDLAALVASRRGVTAKVNDTDRWVADAIIGAGWTPPRKQHPPHVVDAQYTPYCMVCGRDVQWDDQDEEWKH